MRLSYLISRDRCVTLLLAVITALSNNAHNLADYVDTRVGTAPSETVTSGVFGKKTEVLGQTIPAVLVPNGMNFWTPQTRDTELKCIAPYYYLDDKIQGFRNSHWIIGGCTQDYGSMTLMPLYGQLRCSPVSRGTRFDHAAETARPYYYSVDLPDENIKAEMTATSRCAIFRFTYDKGGKAYLVINPNNDENEGFITIDTINNMIYGYNPVHRIYQGKGQPAGYSGHFVVKLDRKPSAYGCYSADRPIPGMTSIGHKNDIGCYVEFDVNPGDVIEARAASSFTGHDGALSNLAVELGDRSFEQVRDALSDTWQKHLQVIEAENDDTVSLRKFYGSMYRASFLPHEVNDVDGRYSPFSTGYPVTQLPEGETRYFDDYSMWDTYRALHPYIVLMYPDMAGEMMQSLVHKYEEGGWMPIFPCWGSYTAAMIGDHGAAAIADAACKGVTNFDLEKAYEGLRRNAFDFPTDEEYIDGKGRRALASYLQYGYIPVEDTVPHAYHKREQTSRTLEYCYDDFALAQIAKRLNREADYNQLMARSANYRNVINPVTGYADGRSADGTFVFDDPFDFSKHITEGAPCHYTWYVPHDPQGLMEAMGGKAAYVTKLDSMFSECRYWHGNEPCHQVAYMYNYADQQWKTSRAVRHIMNTEYFDTPGGLAGNEDAGQMSAWYIFAALGFYPVCPGTPYYMMSGPTFPKVTLHLSNGNDLVINAQNVSDKNIYIKSVRHNGKPYTANYITHEQLMQGGVWDFEMSSKPKK